MKAEDSELTVARLCLGNVSKDFSIDNMNKPGLNEYVYHFSIDYDSIDIDDILDINIL